MERPVDISRLDQGSAALRDALDSDNLNIYDPTVRHTVRVMLRLLHKCVQTSMENAAFDPAIGIYFFHAVTFLAEALAQLLRDTSLQEGD